MLRASFWDQFLPIAYLFIFTFFPTTYCFNTYVQTLVNV